MRRNSLMVALAVGACLAAPAVRPIDEFDDELMREKRDTERRHARREAAVSDEQISAKLSPKIRNAPAGINHRTGEPHKHSREIARRLRQQAKMRGEQQ